MENQGHEATPAEPVETPTPAAPEPAGTVVSEGEAAPTPAQEAAPEATDDKNLSPGEKWAKKAEKFRPKDPKKPQLPPGDAVRGPDGKFLPKDEKAAKQAKKEQEPGEIAPKEGENAPAATTFKVNTKFSVLGKDYELPKYLADAVTTPEQEKELKGIYEKAMGLDHVKQRHQELNDRFVQTSTQHKELLGGVQELRTIYQDAVSTGKLLKLDDFFGKLQINPQVIMQYALARAQYEELDPAQKALIDSHLETDRKARTLEQQNQQFAQDSQVAASQARGLLLDAVLARPDIASAVQAYESQPGRKPGDFRERVRQHGEYTWFSTGGKTDLQPEDAVKQVIQNFGLHAQAPAAPQAQAVAPAGASVVPPVQQAAPQAPAPVAPAPHQKVPVIPSVAGKSGSPTKMKPRSIDDLRKIRKEMDNS